MGEVIKMRVSIDRLSYSQFSNPQTYTVAEVQEKRKRIITYYTKVLSTLYDRYIYLIHFQPHDYYESQQNLIEEFCFDLDFFFTDNDNISRKKIEPIMTRCYKTVHELEEKVNSMLHELNQKQFKLQKTCFELSDDFCFWTDKEIMSLQLRSEVLTECELLQTCMCSRSKKIPFLGTCLAEL
ncbi:hypothetical protein A9Q91_02705 [Candidatus Gracilibacteria bacterium 28_42_T64]|nr:hypothetical protein A9Q91_02705 [Candidatus Gracilibacteria bacterium 28_42_T64]